MPWFRAPAVPHCDVSRAKLSLLMFWILQSFTITSRKHSICFSTSWYVELICVPSAYRCKQAAGGATAAQLCRNTSKKKTNWPKEWRQWRSRCFLLIGWPAGALNRPRPLPGRSVSICLRLTSSPRLWLTEVVLASSGETRHCKMFFFLVFCSVWPSVCWLLPLLAGSTLIHIFTFPHFLSCQITAVFFNKRESWKSSVVASLFRFCF